MVDVTLSTIRIRQQVPITNDLVISSVKDHLLEISVGNTGLSLRYNKKSNSLMADFVPEGKWDINEVQTDQSEWAYRISSIFLYALFHLIQQLKETQHGLLEQIHTDQIIHSTNQHFADFLQKLFQQYGHADLINIYKDNSKNEWNRYKVTLNYKKLLELDESDGLYKFMKRSADRNTDSIVNAFSTK